LRFIKSDLLSENLHELDEYDASVWLQPDELSLSGLGRFGGKAVVLNRYPEGNSFVSTNHREAVKELSLYAFEKSGGDFQAFYLEYERKGKSFVQDERRRGFIDACASWGIFYRLLELPADHEEAVAALADVPMLPERGVVMISGTNVFAGAVLRTAREKGRELNKDFFYADFDNEHSLARMGRQMTTVIQDYSGMGTAVVKALDLIATGEQARIYVPHHIEKGF
jgi:DNA-binding LacI/PurR family transcriptional regulator